VNADQATANDRQPITCKGCGRSFVPAGASGYALYCSRNCQQRHYRAQQRAAKAGELKAARDAETANLPDEPPRGPDEHKALARRLGFRSALDLTVMGYNTDPFYIGTPADKRDAGWFAKAWRQVGAAGAHLRRIYYRLLGSGTLTPTGETFTNFERHWAMLSRAGKYARLLGLVDPEELVDRRSEDAAENAVPRWSEPEPSWSAEPWELTPDWSLDFPGQGELVPFFALPELSTDAGVSVDDPETPDVTVSGYDYDEADQPVLVEVWVEKSGVNDVLEPLCRGLHVNLKTGVGFESHTHIVSLLRRVRRHGKPAHVLYVSDFDPAGWRMPVAVARVVQFYAAELGVEQPVTLHPVALTGEQVDRYRLPRVPVKEDKTGRPDRRGKRFEQANEEGIVELDALEALHPGTLADVVRRSANGETTVWRVNCPLRGGKRRTPLTRSGMWRPPMSAPSWRG
jgi:hypothetical protein